MTVIREQPQSAPTSSTAREVDEFAAPQLAWQLIDEARHRRVTGELCLTTASPSKIRVYLDFGLVYFAERETDETLATRLVLAGAIDPDQLHRGSLQLNGVEHLGRLFDRDATVARDEVELALEMMTEQTMMEIAEHEVFSSQITMYRHHASGVARWFVQRRPTQREAELSVEHVPRTPESCAWKPPRTAPVDTAPPVGVPLRNENEVSDLPANGLFDDDLTAVTPPDDPSVMSMQPLEPVQPLISIKALVAITAASVVPESGNLQGPVAKLAQLTPISGLKPTPISGQVKMISGAVPVTTNGHRELLDNHDDSIPVPEDVAAAVRRAITAIEAATHGMHGSDSVNFGPLHVTSPGVTAPAVTVPPLLAGPRVASAARPGLVTLTSTRSGLVSLTGSLVTGEQPVQTDTDPVHSLRPISMRTVETVQPDPVIAAFVGSARHATTTGANDERRGALRRLIAGVRRR